MRRVVLTTNLGEVFRGETSSAVVLELARTSAVWDPRANAVAWMREAAERAALWAGRPVSASGPTAFLRDLDAGGLAILEIET